jgi:XapX domain-containing protein
MTAALIGMLLGLVIGAGCRWFDLPLPAPPKLVGALLVVAMTLGFLGTDLLLSRVAADRAGGPTTSGGIRHDVALAVGTGN